MAYYHVVGKPINFSASNDSEAISALFEHVTISGEYALMRSGGPTFFSGFVDLESSTIRGAHLTNRCNVNRSNGHI
jgi:hypothetical protein